VSLSGLQHPPARPQQLERQLQTLQITTLFQTGLNAKFVHGLFSYLQVLV
jgi:hypothetical protein